MKQKSILIILCSLITIIGLCHNQKNRHNNQDEKKLNFSSVLLSYQEAVYGFIGNNYQRFYIHFDSISPQDSSYMNYLVYGKIMINKKISIVSGKLFIRQIMKDNKEYNTNYNLQDTEIQKRHSFEKYIMTSELQLFENAHLKESGLIAGIIKSFFYVKENVPYFYDIDLEFDDSICNNLFIGEWISYRDNVRKKCCWGTFRIPSCGDLDVGSAEFHPHPKYKDYGWEDLIRAYETDSDEDWAKEHMTWWK